MAGPPVQQNATGLKPFAWSERSTKAASLVADDVLTDEQIADDIGINRSTLHRWKKHPEFQAKVQQHIGELQERARQEGFGRFDKRKQANEDMIHRIDALIAARGEEMADEVAGGDTGLLVRQYKSVTVTYEKDPDDPESKATAVRTQVAEYHVDTGLMRERRELLKQIPQDAGQWSEKREVSGPDGGPVIIREIRVPKPEGDA